MLFSYYFVGWFRKQDVKMEFKMSVDYRRLALALSGVLPQCMSKETIPPLQFAFYLDLYFIRLLICRVKRNIIYINLKKVFSLSKLIPFEIF